MCLLAVIFIIFSLLVACADEEKTTEDSTVDNTEESTTDQQLPAMEGSDTNLCGDGTCDAAEEESGLCDADC